MIGDLENARDEVGRQLYPDASTVFAGLETVSAVAATQPVVYDSSRLWMAIRRDFQADFSNEVSEAWNRFATSLRIVGRVMSKSRLGTSSSRSIVLPALALPVLMT